MKKLGALWVRVSKKGEKYLSGIIEIEGNKTKVVGFKRIDKKNEKSPDFELFLQEPKQDQSEEPGF